MAKYFVAGVGRALLFKGENLFADCRTLADVRLVSAYK